MSSFHDRIDHLIAAVRPGVLESADVVDQVYAKYQELRDDLILHGGGRHHYTRDALFDHEQEIMQIWADHLLTEDGSDIVKGAEQVAELVARHIYEYAPFEFGDLKASPHPTVTDDGAVVYDRPPAQHRLTEEELRAKGDLRRLGLGNARGDDLHRALGNLG